MVNIKDKMLTLTGPLSIVGRSMVVRIQTVRLYMSMPVLDLDPCLAAFQIKTAQGKKISFPAYMCYF